MPIAVPGTVMKKPSSIIEDRKKKAQAIRDLGIHLYPAGYDSDMTASEAIKQFGEMDGEAL